MSNDMHPTVHLVCAQVHDAIIDLRNGLFAMGFHVQAYTMYENVPVETLPKGSGWIILEERDAVVDAALQLWRSAGGLLPVIVMSDAPSLENAKAAIRAGAVDYVPRDLTDIRAALAKTEAWPQPPSTPSATSFADVLSGDHLTAPLTKRERDVLVRIGEGKSNKAIALELGISHRTVETHRSNMMRKMGVHTLAEVLSTYVQTVNALEWEKERAPEIQGHNPTLLE